MNSNLLWPSSEKHREQCSGNTQRGVGEKEGLHYHQSLRCRGFPGGAVVKDPPANAGVAGSSPGPGRSHMLRSN